MYHPICRNPKYDAFRRTVYCKKDTANCKVTKLQLALALNKIRERLAEEDAEDARLYALEAGGNIK